MSDIAPACRPFEADLSALLDDELTPDRAAAVQAHLDGCARCRGRYRQLCQVDLELAGLPVAAVPADLRGRLDERIAAGGPARVVPATARDSVGAAPPRRRRGRSRRALVAGISAAAAVALYLVVNRAGPVLPGASDEELAVVLELETIEDLDLIANLELLEQLLALEQGARG